MQGDTRAASELVTQSLRLRREIAEPLGIASVLETLAWVAAASDPKRAVTLLGAAENEWDKVDTSTQFVPGLEARRRETTDAARTQLGDVAFDLAWSQGRTMDQADAIAFALKEQPAPPAMKATGPIALASQSVLTRRERQVAELIHKGLSNRAIAETLVISRRTAETHVEHILTKLGFTNRSQVAAWVGEQLRSEDP